MNHDDRTAVAPLFLDRAPGEPATALMPQVRTPHSGVRLNEVEQAIRRRESEATKVYAFPVPRAFAEQGPPDSTTRPFDTKQVRAAVTEDTSPAIVTQDPFTAHERATSITRRRVDDEDQTRFDVVPAWADAAIETTLCSPGIVRDAPATERPGPRAFGLDEPVTDVGGLPKPMFGWVEAVCNHVLGAALAVARILGRSNAAG